MKYPQLVPTRAVNAISDWLVSRLELLGVDSPHIYTRLLLSLLQSTVQINDPNEFNNLENYLANRKGNSNKRYLACDTDTLKKLNAIQCLQEIVSTDQDLTTIEDLVDELCEKLNEIERKSSLASSSTTTTTTLTSTSILTTTTTTTATLSLTAELKDNHQEEISINEKSNYCELFDNIHIQQHQHQQRQQKSKIISRNSIVDSVCSIENDPKHRYFRAFPALSKEMEDSFFIWRRNAKSLTWPPVSPGRPGPNWSKARAARGGSSPPSTAQAQHRAQPRQTEPV
jgi:hypothetical protein